MSRTRAVRNKFNYMISSTTGTSAHNVARASALRKGVTQSATENRAEPWLRIHVWTSMVHGWWFMVNGSSGSRLMVHGTWLMAHRTGLMAKEERGQERPTNEPLAMDWLVEELGMDKPTTEVLGTTENAFPAILFEQ